MKTLTNEILTKAAKTVENMANELNKNDDKYDYKSSVNAKVKNPDAIRYIDVELKEERIVDGNIRNDTIIIAFTKDGDALSVEGSFSLLHLQWFIEAVAKEMKE
jgi:hypothetical protein